MPDLASLRRYMVERQLRARGIRDPAVLAAMAEVPREEFVAPELVELAYEDSPLPIEERQTISQPYVVALMIEALELRPGDRVLEIGTGSGYAAAVLSRIVRQVYTVERHATLAASARQRFVELGLANIEVLHGDGTLGWPEHAPYDAILVSAGGPDVPRPLAEQLAPAGRLLIPVGATPRQQELLRLRRLPGVEELRREDLGAVAFVPLVGEAGWAEERHERCPLLPRQRALTERIAAAAEPLEGVDTGDLGALLSRMGEARVVLLGEATHGTSEFYRLRARITRELVERRGFTVIAVEADWPDAAAVDRWIRRVPVPAGAAREPPFSRFPTWMWANREVLELVEWLWGRNAGLPAPQQAGFYGLDLYSLYDSIAAVLQYLEGVDPEAAAQARRRYGCLTPGAEDAAAYGAAAFFGRRPDCEAEVVENLRGLLARRLEYLAQDGPRFLDAVQNARLVANAERYYRTLYQGSRASWNLRDKHMFDTLLQVLDAAGQGSRAVVWAHNSHLGDATATEMAARGEINLGQLVRQHFAEQAYLVGFGTDRGTVAAAPDWGAPMEVMELRPALPESFEHLCHRTGLPAFLLPLRGATSELAGPLMEPRLERAIGVVYRPDTERRSHYFHALLARQFDEWVWLDETCAVTPLDRRSQEGVGEGFPFGL
jgi:protein-L-isoaspartate(D-aspartate) O-methyltransferase